MRVPLGLAAAIAVASAVVLAALVVSGLGRRFGLGGWLVADVVLVVGLHAVLLGLPLAVRAAWLKGRLLPHAPIVGCVIGAVPLGAALLAAVGVRSASDWIAFAEVVATTGLAGALGGAAYALAAGR